MDDLGAEIGQFAGLVVAECGQRNRVGHELRIGRQDAVGIAPEGKFPRIAQGRENCGGIVAAVAAENGRAPVAGARDEACGDERSGAVIDTPTCEARRTRFPVDARAEFAMADHDNLARIEERVVLSPDSEKVREQTC